MTMIFGYFSVVKWKVNLLTIITKRSILDVAAALDPPLKLVAAK